MKGGLLTTGPPRSPQNSFLTLDNHWPCGDSTRYKAVSTMLLCGALETWAVQVGSEACATFDVTSISRECGLLGNRVGEMHITRTAAAATAGGQVLDLRDGRRSWADQRVEFHFFFMIAL